MHDSPMNLSQLKWVVVGATGNVGQEFLKVLLDKQIPAQQITALASAQSKGQTVQYGKEKWLVQDLAQFDFSMCDIALFSAGAAVSKVFAPQVETMGCWVVDNTSFFRMDEDIALVIPEINSESILHTNRRIISNPNCSTIQMLMALAPIDAVARLKRVIVSTYQSVSGAGRSAVQELFAQKRGEAKSECFPRRIDGNVIPQIDVWMKDGSTKEEWKMVVETKKILGRDLKVAATCVRVPVVRGHSEAIYFELEEDVPVETLKKALNAFPGLIVTNFQEEFVTPLEVENHGEVFVSRLRKDPFVKGAYQMWVVADNLLKGAALNAVQIAKKLVEFGLVGGEK